MNPAPFQIKKGLCSALYAYDIGLSIDLEKCRRQMASLTKDARIRHNRRAPKFFDYDPAPLLLTLEDTPIEIGRFKTSSTLDLALYDFGGVSIGYTIPFSGDFERLRELSGLLYEDDELLEDSRKVAGQLLDTIRAAVARPQINELVEDYAVFQIEQYESRAKLEEVCHAHAQELTRILLAETQDLSDQEVSDALSCRLSFSREDLAVIDWNAAILFDRDASDVRAVLEFANLELLEMRVLDHQLDYALDRSYEILGKTNWMKHLLPGSAGGTVRLVSQLQVDGAILFERVSNAPKLLGDQYLARLYRLAAQRFHLPEWNTSILRKLDTIESIYKQMHDRAASWRLEMLEWIIVVLIFIELLIPLFPQWFVWLKR